MFSRWRSNPACSEKTRRWADAVWKSRGIHLTKPPLHVVWWGMQDYPRTLGEFEVAFATDEACRDYLARLRWPEGFRCPRCGNMKPYVIGATLCQCSACRYQSQPQDIEVSLVKWIPQKHHL